MGQVPFTLPGRYQTPFDKDESNDGDDDDYGDEEYDEDDDEDGDRCLLC